MTQTLVKKGDSVVRWVAVTPTDPRLESNQEGQAVFGRKVRGDSGAIIAAAYTVANSGEVVVYYAQPYFSRVDSMRIETLVDRLRPYAAGEKP